MNVIVIGLGSMGKRRIRLLREMYPDVYIVGVDGREDRRKETNGTFGIDCFAAVSDVSISLDCAFVCTSPLSHSVIIEDCLNRGWHVFTELNLVSDGYDSNLRIAKEKGLKLFLSSTFLYREEIRYLTEKIMGEKKWNYIYHIGQYLPDWHPWENYNDFFLGDRRTNGCREILAIELPWIVNAFGEVKKLTAVSDKNTELNIDYDDNFMIQIEHVNGNKGCLIVDVVSPVPVRKLEVLSEGSYYTWDGTPEGLKQYDPDANQLKEVSFSERTERTEGYRAFVVENAYKNEIKEFFSVIRNEKSPIYGFEQDRRVLELIDMIGA